MLLAYCKIQEEVGPSVNPCVSSFCRLVKGPTLNHHLFYQSLVRSLGSEQEYEQSMLDLGAQLVQVSGILQPSMRCKIDYHIDAA